MARRLVAAFCLILAASAALAGAWETGPLDNDVALDFLNRAQASPDEAPLRQIFAAALANPKGYLDDEIASGAIAAAELVAAMKGAPAPELPAPALDWAKRRSSAADPSLVQLAIRAIDRIATSSETRDLWAANGEKDLPAWLAGLRELRQRLASARPAR
jgi:hypothetical protein